MNYAASTLLRFVPPVLSGSAHAALIVALIVISPVPKDSAGAGVNVFEVAMVDEGELAQMVPSPGAPPEMLAPPVLAPEDAAVAPPPELPAPVTPALVEPVAPPESVAPDAEVVPVPKPKLTPRNKPPAVAERPRPSVQPRSVAPRREASSSRETSPREASAGGSQPREGAQARGGAGRAGSPGNAVSGAAYAGKVRAILQARANALGIEDQEGSVGLSFVIGGAGRMERHAITRTSGSASVDRMIRGMMASASFPPPPGGRFSGTVNIRIQ